MMTVPPPRRQVHSPAGRITAGAPAFSGGRDEAAPQAPAAKKTPGVVSAQHPSGPSGKRHQESFLRSCPASWRPRQKTLAHPLRPARRAGWRISAFGLPSSFGPSDFRGPRAGHCSWTAGRAADRVGDGSHAGDRDGCLERHPGPARRNPSHRLQARGAARPRLRVGGPRPGGRRATRGTDAVSPSPPAGEGRVRGERNSPSPLPVPSSLPARGGGEGIAALSRPSRGGKNPKSPTVNLISTGSASPAAPLHPWPQSFAPAGLTARQRQPKFTRLRRTLPWAILLRPDGAEATATQAASLRQAQGGLRRRTP